VKKLSSLVLLIMVGSTATAGSIDIGTPLVAGDVAKFENRQKTADTDLSSERLLAVSDWLDQHRSGWQGMITPGSSEPVQLEANLKHRDGHITTMSVIAGGRGGYYLRVTGPGTMAYRSLWGFFQSWAATRWLSDQDLAALRSLFGVT
jgi:hypothetical protein